MSSNSFMTSAGVGRCQEDPGKVGGVEEGVTQDGRHEIAGSIVKLRPENAQKPEREHGCEVGVNQGEDERNHEAAADSETAIAGEGPEHTTKDHLFEHRRAPGREHQQDRLFPGARGAENGFDGGLRVGTDAELFQDDDATLVESPGGEEGRDGEADGEQEVSDTTTGEKPEGVGPGGLMGAKQRNEGEKSDPVEYARGAGELPRRLIGRIDAQGEKQCVPPQPGNGKAEEQQSEESQCRLEAPRLGGSHVPRLPEVGAGVRGFGRAPGLTWWTDRREGRRHGHDRG